MFKFNKIHSKLKKNIGFSKFSYYNSLICFEHILLDTSKGVHLFFATNRFLYFNTTISHA